MILFEWDRTSLYKVDDGFDYSHLVLPTYNTPISTPLGDIMLGISKKIVTE